MSSGMTFDMDVCLLLITQTLLDVVFVILTRIMNKALINTNLVNLFSVFISVEQESKEVIISGVLRIWL